MIVDASALVCVILGERDAASVRDALEQNQNELKMSTVNLTEVLIVVQGRHPGSFETLIKLLRSYPIEFVPPSAVEAILAASVRLRFLALNLGDCFAYALAKLTSEPLLTLDEDFRKTDIAAIFP